MPVRVRWVGVPTAVEGLSGLGAAVPGVEGPSGTPTDPAPPIPVPAPPPAAPPPAAPPPAAPPPAAPPPAVWARAAPESAVATITAMTVKPARFMDAAPRKFYRA